MDHEDLQIRRDLEHVETAAADLIALNPEEAIPYAVAQVERLVEQANQVNHPAADLIAHCLWLGWERAYRVWKERHGASESENTPDSSDKD